MASETQVEARTKYVPSGRPSICRLATSSIQRYEGGPESQNRICAAMRGSLSAANPRSQSSSLRVAPASDGGGTLWSFADRITQVFQSPGGGVSCATASAAAVASCRTAKEAFFIV